MNDRARLIADEFKLDVRREAVDLGRDIRKMAAALLRSAELIETGMHTDLHVGDAAKIVDFYSRAQIITVKAQTARALLFVETEGEKAP